MYYIVETDKSFEQASTDLESAVKHHSFGVLHVHNIGNTLRGKGIASYNLIIGVTDNCNAKRIQGCRSPGIIPGRFSMAITINLDSQPKF